MIYASSLLKKKNLKVAAITLQAFFVTYATWALHKLINWKAVPEYLKNLHLINIMVSICYLYLTNFLVRSRILGGLGVFWSCSTLQYALRTWRPHLSPSSEWDGMTVPSTCSNVRVEPLFFVVKKILFELKMH